MNLIKVSKETRIADLLKVAFPDKTFGEWGNELDGVGFLTISARYASEWHYAFGGIQLAVFRVPQNEIREVLVKNGQIDLDQIRAKHAELVPIALQYQKERQAAYERAEQQRDRLKAFCARHGIDEYNASIDSGGTFTLRFADLTEGQADAMMAAYQKRVTYDQTTFMLLAR